MLFCYLKILFPPLFTPTTPTRDIVLIGFPRSVFIFLSLFYIPWYIFRQTPSFKCPWNVTSSTSTLKDFPPQRTASLINQSIPMFLYKITVAKTVRDFSTIYRAWRFIIVSTGPYYLRTQFHKAQASECGISVPVNTPHFLSRSDDSCSRVPLLTSILAKRKHAQTIFTYILHKISLKIIVRAIHTLHK